MTLSEKLRVNNHYAAWTDLQPFYCLSLFFGGRVFIASKKKKKR